MSEYLDKMKRQLPSDEDSFRNLLDFAVRRDDRVKYGTEIIKLLKQQNSELVEALEEIDKITSFTPRVSNANQVKNIAQQALAKLEVN